LRGRQSTRPSPPEPEALMTTRSKRRPANIRGGLFLFSFN
jgi:hypothetical protein